MVEIKKGQIWRDDTGYLYRIVFVDPSDTNYVWARHPNAKPIMTRQIHRSWFDQWERTS